jgi:hypothetical protein
MHKTETLSQKLERLAREQRIKREKEQKTRIQETRQTIDISTQLHDVIIDLIRMKSHNAITSVDIVFDPTKVAKSIAMHIYDQMEIDNVTVTARSTTMSHSVTLYPDEHESSSERSKSDNSSQIESQSSDVINNDSYDGREIILIDRNGVEYVMSDLW